MTIYVFDASALIRYLDREAGWERVKSTLRACAAEQADGCISAVQWGEVAGNLHKRFGASRGAQILSRTIPSEVQIISASGDRAVRAAVLKVDRRISYADGFALELAMESGEHVLVTADYGFKPVADLARIEFLPAK